MNKILIISEYHYNNKSGGGISTAIYNIFLYLKDDFNFTFLSNNKKSNQKKNLFDIKTVFINNNLFYFIRLFLFLKNNYFKKIHINGLFSKNYSFVSLVICSIFYSGEIIISPRGMLKKTAINGSLTKKIYLSILRLILNKKKIIFHGTSKEEIEETTLFFKKFKSVLISDLPPKRIKKKYKTKKDSQILNIISIGRIVDLKNLYFVLTTLMSISKIKNNNIANLNLDICGLIYDFKYWRKCKKIIDELIKYPNINIKYHGEIEKDKINSLFKKSHLLFFPSKGENYGFVIAESLSNLVPVLTSDNTAFDLEKFSFFGFSISLNKKKDFIKIIQNYINLSQDEFNSLRKNIYKNYNTFMKINLKTEDFKMLYKQCL